MEQTSEQPSAKSAAQSSAQASAQSAAQPSAQASAKSAAQSSAQASEQSAAPASAKSAAQPAAQAFSQSAAQASAQSPAQSPLFKYPQTPPKKTLKYPHSQQNHENEHGPLLIDDFDDFWLKETEFKKELESVIRGFGSLESFINEEISNKTIEKLHLEEFRPVWNLIHNERSNATDYRIGFNNIEIHRGTLQLCLGTRWFEVVTMNLAFHNIAFRCSLVNKKVIPLKYEFLHELQVKFEIK